jgi:NAD(P)-dependent dehydrogenase (short-subunit alcohol dehydrogenase family)
VGIWKGTTEVESLEKVAIVSGASTGIGNSCAMYLAKKGIKVYAAWRNPENYKKKADEFFEVLKMDGQDERSIGEAVESVFAREGRIDALITGGGPCLAGAVEETTIEEARLHIESIFFESFRETKAVLPYMRKQGWGKIVFLSGMPGWSGIPYHALYSASRFAVEGFAESLRMELLPLDIHVSIVESSNFKIGIEYSGMTQAAASLKSPYKDACERVSRWLLRKNPTGAEIVAVAKCVIRILDSRRPKTRYPVGGGFQAFAIRLKRPLVSRWYERTISRYYAK